MGGCGDSDRGCPSSGGCGTSKTTQRALIGRVLGKLYPTGRWGALDDEARYRRGLGRAGGQRLARAMAEALKSPTYFVDGGPDELCDFVYVLCVGREPGLIAVRDGREELEPGAGDLPVSERYLRIALSSLARLACIQECTVELMQDAELGQARWIRETPRAGVYDPVLLKRFQKAIDLCEASGLRHLDMGVIDTEPLGMDGSDYALRYSDVPRIVNYLFYPQPTNTARTTEIGGPSAAQVAAAISHAS